MVDLMVVRKVDWKDLQDLRKVDQMVAWKVVVKVAWKDVKWVVLMDVRKVALTADQ